MVAEPEQRSRSKGKPVATFRTSWQMLMLLDSLAELEGSSRGRIINAALFQYAEDYLAVRARLTPDFLANLLRRIDILQRRIEADLQQGKEGNTEELQENRRDMLHEAYRYARYLANSESCELLSITAGWVARTFGSTDPSEAQTSELKAFVQALLDRHNAQANALRNEKGSKQAAL